jgi:hypothetical protein
MAQTGQLHLTAQLPDNQGRVDRRGQPEAKRSGGSAYHQSHTDAPVHQRVGARGGDA